jgi:murein L,D-transpeptidase YafK
MKKKLQKAVTVLMLIILATIIGLATYYFFPESKLPKGCKADKILVEKSNRKMHVYSEGKKLKTYTISLGFSPNGRKRFEGDGKTPEGVYYINRKNSRSIAHKSLGISYPDMIDKQYATKRRKSAGGHIMIHGLMNGFGYMGKFHRFIDWTGGCIAITNSEMDDLFRHIEVGCKLEIVE